MYIIDHEKLQVGDIILTAEKTLQSKTVRLFTWGEFSHAMIWADGTLIHSDGGGVYSKNTQRLLFDKLSEVIVLRPRIKLNALQRGIIINYPRSLVGTVYSVKEAIAVKRPIKPKATYKQFCSRLVAQTYYNAGIKIVKNPDYCSPEEINKSKKILMRVNNCVREATQEEIYFSTTRDPGQETQDDTIKMLIEIRNKFGQNIQTIGNVCDFIMKEPTHDAEITEIAKNSGYFNHAEVDIEINHWRYNEDEFIKVAKMANYQLLELARFIHDIGNSSASIHYAQLKEFEEKFRVSGFDFFKQHIFLYKKLINTQYLRQDLARKIMSDI